MDVEGNPRVLPESANLPPRGDKPGDGFLEHSLADLVTLMKSELDAAPPSGRPNPTNAPP